MPTGKLARYVFLGLALSILVLAGCQHQPKDPGPMTNDGRLAPLLDNLGDLHREITTSDPMAQRYFDQGLTLVYAFNHAEAERSFKEAARIDPDCVMAYWGQALAAGPNINDTAPGPEREQAAYEAIQEAWRRRDRASETERALVGALATRFSPNAGQDRDALNAAYAKAMADLYARYPDDGDVGVLYPEALMSLTPWDYWLEDGTPKPGTEPVVPAIEAVIAAYPDHPGARHLYIHAVEASNDPDRAVASADHLGTLAPAAGHLVHMPSHIYIRVGRYADGSAANIRAIAADEDYLTQCRSQGIYPAAYYPHNIHFLTATLGMEGRGAEMLQAARKVADQPDEAAYCRPGFGFPHLLKAQPLFAMVRFGRWDEILAEPSLPADQLFAGAIQHYARGLAHLAKGDLKAAQAELNSLEALSSQDALEELKIWGSNSLRDLAMIGRDVLAGEIAAKRRRFDEAVRRLTSAIEIEDSLTYSEPPDWPIPVRHNLGAVLLEAGRAAEAEQVFRQDLERHRNNGWSLAGLARSLEGQGKSREAAETKAELTRVWARADVEAPSARF